MRVVHTSLSPSRARELAKYYARVYGDHIVDTGATTEQAGAQIKNDEVWVTVNPDEYGNVWIEVVIPV